ncbi:protealysin inhibitor emfourin [Larkinella rosea]|uniref:Uncharacterized protein n=1 Tax=Larkinella rosea TaxID=2025312 RepID=A0A3P1C1N5_9BACT|nr:protealysin inhibitor emfourin [Larkinella rosea]RRB07207.1 hypothetical protein EHT25_05345 [Larkinella rosea]
MKLSYVREGGLFFQVSETEMEVGDLPADLQTLVRKVYENSDDYRPREKNVNLRDGYQYRLEIREGRKKVNLTFGDTTLPDGFQPLIQYLQEKAINDH